MCALASLILLGASVRAAAESAVRAGALPYCIDLFADADTRALGQVRKIERYPAEFLAALAEAPQAPWMYTGSLENYPRLIERMAQVRPLVGNHAEKLKLVRDPAWLSGAALGTGVRCPETCDMGQFFPRDVGWLMKPRRSGGGMGVEVVISPRLIPPDKPGGIQEASLSHYICQRFVPGESFSASFLAAGKRVQFLGTAGQWTGVEYGAPQPFQYAGSYAPFGLSANEERSLIELATKIPRAAGLRGLFGLDLIRGQGGLWLIEVNPRYTASMELLEGLMGRSFVADHCAEFGYELSRVDQKDLSKHLSTGYYSPGREGEQPRPEQKPLSKLLSLGLRASASAATLGKRIVYADHPGIVGSRYRAVIEVIESTAGVIAADVPTMDSVIDNGSPICTVIAAAESLSAVDQLLSGVADQIRQSLDPLPVGGAG